jgi:hypothetical protein
VRFRAGRLEFHATVTEATETPSPRTGDVLRSLTIQFRAQKADLHEDALVEAGRRASGGLFSLGESDQPELEWRVRDSTHQYIGSEPWGINHHLWRIEQIERLACERLIIGSVTLEPYDYAEEVVDDGVVCLAARAFISEQDLDRLSRIADCVEVVRVGISDEARQMSVSYVWGERPEGRVAVVRGQDVREPRVSVRTATTVVDPSADLLAVLRAKGILGDADLDELRQQRHLARRVADVDAWAL